MPITYFFAMTRVSLQTLVMFCKNSWLDFVPLISIPWTPGTGTNYGDTCSTHLNDLLYKGHNPLKRFFDHEKKQQSANCQSRYWFF